MGVPCNNSGKIVFQGGEQRQQQESQLRVRVVLDRVEQSGRADPGKAQAVGRGGANTRLRTRRRNLPRGILMSSKLNLLPICTRKQLPLLSLTWQNI